MNTYWNMLYLERPPYATWSIESTSATEAGNILIYIMYFNLYYVFMKHVHACKKNFGKSV